MIPHPVDDVCKRLLAAPIITKTARLVNDDFVRLSFPAGLRYNERNE